MDVTSSTAGSMVALRQAQGQADFGIRSLQANAQQEAGVAALVGAAAGPAVTGGTGGSSSGGNVTETRGQNLNIVV